MLLLFLGACAFRPPQAPPAYVAAEAPVQTVRMPVRDGRVRVGVRAGSAHDPPGREGLAWVTAHAIATGVGASVKVGPDIVLFEVAAADAGRLAAALVTPPGAGTMATARRDALSTLESLDCREIGERAWDAWVYAGHPYGHAPEGRRSVVPTLSDAEVAGFQALRYVRSAVVIGLPDGVLLHPFFAELPAQLSASPVPATRMPLPAERVLTITAEGQRCLVAGHPGPPLDDPAAQAAESLLAGAGGLIHAVRREARRLVYLPLPRDAPASSVVADVLAGYWKPPSEPAEIVASHAPERAILTVLLARDPWPSLAAPLPSGPLPTAADIATAPPFAPSDLAVAAALGAWLDPQQVRLVQVLPPGEAAAAGESLAQSAVEGAAAPPAILTAQELLR